MNFTLTRNAKSVFPGRGRRPNSDRGVSQGRPEPVLSRRSARSAVGLGLAARGASLAGSLWATVRQAAVRQIRRSLEKLGNDAAERRWTFGNYVVVECRVNPDMQAKSQV